MPHLSWMVAIVTAALALHPSAAPEAPKPLVVVELFTSEGCSSCPPADALLRRLAADTPIAGAEVVALGFHIDYWDRLGWKDPFSSPHATERQRTYSEALHLNQVYTPQMVVNGTREFIGSDEPHARAAIEAAAKLPIARIPLSATRKDATATATIQVLEGTSANDFDLFLLVTESDLSTEVRRGENAGKHLDHAPVVRLLTRVADLKPGDLKTELKLGPDWKRDHLKVIALLQSKTDRHIIAAGTCAIQ